MNDTRIPGQVGFFDAASGALSALRNQAGQEQPIPQWAGGRKTSVATTLTEADWGQAVTVVAQAADKIVTVPAGLPPGFWCLVVYRNSNSAAGRAQLANDGTSILEWGNGTAFATTSPFYIAAANQPVSAAVVMMEKAQDSFFVFPLGGTLSTT